MMIFRILCGEWIEPLWDCMRAEEKVKLKYYGSLGHRYNICHLQEGASTCFAIFLPTLVMGNFMVLNLFLALLLNSFNSEELKSKKEVSHVFNNEILHEPPVMDWSCLFCVMSVVRSFFHVGLPRVIQFDPLWHKV